MDKVIRVAPLARMGQPSHVGKPWRSEREVVARYGPRWRETAQTPREGGDRRRDYYDQGAGRK